MNNGSKQTSFVVQRCRPTAKVSDFRVSNPIIGSLPHLTFPTVPLCSVQTPYRQIIVMVKYSYNAHSPASADLRKFLDDLRTFHLKEFVLKPTRDGTILCCVAKAP